MRCGRSSTLVRSLLIGVLAFTAVGFAACDGDDDYRMTWRNTYGVVVRVLIEGQEVQWRADGYPDSYTLAPGASRTTFLSYPAGHYEYMVFEVPSGKGVVCEGRLDLDSGNKTFETIPTPGGSTYEARGGGMCN